eukprot:s772_g14.t1
MDSATLHVRADEKPGFLRYALHVSRSSPRITGRASVDKESLWESSGWTSPLDFQIEVALDALLEGVSQLTLPGALEGSQALVWKGGWTPSGLSCVISSTNVGRVGNFF